MTNSHVFISYSRQDKVFVDKLIADLQKASVNVWIDKEGLKVGTPDWEQAIRDAIRGSYAVLVIASPDSRESRFVRDELLIAEMYNCSLLAIWASGEQWAECVRLGLIGTQYADARGKNYENALSEVIRSLNNFRTAPVKKSSTQPILKPEPDFEPRNPYKGLRAFTSTDKGDFFGRDKLIANLVETLKETSETNRFLAIVGPSGSGKSSIVMAGLFPHLRDGALPGSENWIYLDPVLPGSQPIESLAVVLSNGLNVSITSVLEDLNRGSRGLHLLARRLVRERTSRVVLLIDQFEELFTQTLDPEQRDHFIDLLITAATEPNGQTLILITLRADFYDRPMNYPELGKLLESRSKSVLPMELEDLRNVIEKPAKLPDVRLSFEPGLIGDLLFEVSGQVGALPLLQFTLEQLVRNRSKNLLTIDAYRKLGGIKGALAKYAEFVYGKFTTEEDQKLVRSLFLRLIEPGAGEQDLTRRRIAFSELALPDRVQSERLKKIVLFLTDKRLLMTNRVANVATVEVSHEALLREWSRLADWIRTAREDIQTQQRISRDAEEWLKREKRSDDLYRGIKLREARAWAARNVPSTIEMRFIQTAIQFEQKQLSVADQQLRQELSATQVRTKAIYQMAGLLSSDLNYERVIETGLQTGVLGLRPTEQSTKERIVAAALLFRPSDNLLYVAANRGFMRMDEGKTIRGETGIVGQCLKQVEPIIGVNPNFDPELEFFASFQDMKAVLCVPLRAGYDSYGVFIYASNLLDAFTESDADLMGFIASQATVALQNALLYQNLQDERDRMIEADNSTRKKLAQDLHDGPVQNVAAIAGSMGVISKMLAQSPEKIPAALDKVEDLARRTVNEMTHMLFTLHPSAIENEGLKAALNQIAEKMYELYNQAVTVQLDKAAAATLNLNQQSTLFYVIEEAVNNARKFAHATTIDISLKRLDDSIVVTVADNGVGFDTKIIERQQKNSGISKMRQRIEFMSGSLRLESVLGRGTSVVIFIPVAGK